MAVIPVGVGETYETWAAALAYVAGLGPMSESHILRQVADTAETSTGTISIDLNGFNLTIESDTPHGGDPTVGWKSTSATINAKVIGVGLTGVGIFEVKDLHIAVNQIAGPFGIHVVPLDDSLKDVLIHDCIVTNAVLSVANAGVRVVPAVAVTTLTVKIYNIEASGFQTNIVVAPYQGGNWLVENVTAVNSKLASFNFGGAAGGTAVCRNCIGHSALDVDFTGVAFVEGYNNASVDASAANANWLAGSGNQTLITLNDEFVSQTLNDANFLKLANTGVCHDGGSAPSIVGNTEGIRDTARPHGSLYSIGADEYGEVGPTPSSSSSSSSSSGTPQPIIQPVVATVPGKLPNMGRTLLLNMSGGSASAAFANEYVPPYYTAVDLPSGLQVVRRALFGSAADSAGMNYAVWQYMRILHSTEYADWITALDPRVTYLSDASLVGSAFGASISPDDGALQFVGEPGLGGASGRLTEAWNIQQLTSTSYRITNMRTRRSENHVVSVSNGITDFMPMTGHADFKVRVQTDIATTQSWSVQYLAKPGAEMDPVNRAAQASNIGIEAYTELFPAREPYKLFKQLWEQHSLFPYRMSGYLLALIYRTEEIRRAG